MTLLMLDAAFPGTPDQVVADCVSVGATACAVYAYGPVTNWSAAHVSALLNATISPVPIIVPGDSPPAPSDTIAPAGSLGLAGGPLVLDLEPTSEPASAWVSDWIAAASSLGFSPRRYGNSSVLAGYPAAGGDWIAAWIQTGAVDPIPTLPADGRLAWQYVNNVTLASGGLYDASIYDPAFLGGSSVATIDQVYDLAFRVNKEVGYDDSGNITSGGVADVLIKSSHTVEAGVKSLQTAVSQLPGGSVQLQPVLDAIAALSTKVDTVSAKVDALARHLGQGTP